MKSERRHELQHNELADWLFRIGNQLKPYQNAVWMAVVALVVVVAAYTWWSRASATRSAQAWNDLSVGMNTGNMEVLSKVAEGNPGTTVGYIAALVKADILLAQGCNDRFASKVPAMRSLKDAVAGYAMVLDGCQTPSLRERATYGLGRAKEAQGEIESATDNYQKVVDTWPEGTYASAANERLQELKQPDTKLMLQDLAKYDPKPAFSEEFEEPAAGPSFNETVPDEMPATKPAAKTDDKKDSKKENEAKK